MHVPVIAVTEPEDGGVALRDALSKLAEFDWLIVTSPAGSERVAEAARTVSAVRLATVGTATARALERGSGRRVDLVPPVQRAESLASAFSAQVRSPQRVLVAQADIAAPDARGGPAPFRPRRDGRRGLPNDDPATGSGSRRHRRRRRVRQRIGGRGLVSCVRHRSATARRRHRPDDCRGSRPIRTQGFGGRCRSFSRGTGDRTRTCVCRRQADSAASVAAVHSNADLQEFWAGRRTRHE